MVDPVFERMTRLALERTRAQGDAEQAWTAAGAAVDCKQSVREKGCPRAAFVSLVQHGYVFGVSTSLSPKPLSRNALYVLTAARLVRAKPELADSKSKLWEAVRLEHGVERRSHNGVLDVFFALRNANALKE